MKKKTLAALAVPTLALALGLSACGSGSTPGLSGGSSAAPASSSAAGGGGTAAPESSSAAASSAAPETSSAAPEAPAGAADLDAAIEKFIASSSGTGFTKVPAAQIKAAFAGAKAALAPVTVDPAACKDLMLKSVDLATGDMEFGMALKQMGQKSTTVTYFSQGVQYVKDIMGVYDEMASKCKGMKQEVSGTKLEVTIGAWDASGVNAENVHGTTETTVMASGTMVQTKVFATKGDTAVQVQVLGDGGAADEANAVKLVNEALNALAG
ncbi:hypothetical protein DWB68_09575 [Galactobacter valiniphilus]|uniref:Lipoprotein n=1 Tax=Galactobacter valiniphilus TaxID=2676122 RepID=A0A399J8X1_9MICC|nr:hypothetical protein [Galactobacter valiniphilus]RII42021.1 hypothetical protein DWB68_09575 [Galactobacter valiniphilus]